MTNQSEQTQQQLTQQHQTQQKSKQHTQKRHKYIITGGPASGKSTIIKALSERDYNIIPEAARDVIAQHGLIDDVYARQSMILCRQREYELCHTKPGLNILDRSMYDIAAYCTLLGVPLPSDFSRATRAAQYYPQALLLQLPPTQEEYNTLSKDGLRFETYEMATRIETLLGSIYQQAGFEIQRIPWMADKSQRLECVVSTLSTITNLRRNQLERK
jgi:predicted ATPase